MNADKHRRILLSVNGMQDPFNKQEKDGPILTLLEFRCDFDEIWLFFTNERLEQVEQTKQLINQRHGITVRLCQLHLEDAANRPDPTNYAMILKELRRYIPKMDFVDNSYIIYTSPGTPEMQACWLLLAASQEIVAGLIQKPSPQFLSPGQDPINEIKPDTPDFPMISQRQAIPERLSDSITEEDIKKCMAAAGIVGNAPSFQDAIKTAANAARTGSSILILGESGSGKEGLAKFVHLLSGRPVERFVAENCTAIPETLFESEFFGHKRGAFTGAIYDKTGFFEQAHKGTLFLDEIGDMPLNFQAKILRVLQDKHIKRLGDSNTREVDFRLVAATNKDLKAKVMENLFREDLYYRLAVIPIELPALRQRMTDIPLLAQHILDKLNAREGRHVRILPGAVRRLMAYNWPGNIRELSNIIENAHSQAMNNEILPETIGLAGEPDLFTFLPDPYEGFDWPSFCDEIHDRLFQRALDISGGVQSKAARLLGVSNESVRKYRNKKGIIKA